MGVALDSLVRRTRELGITSEISARRAYQRIQQLKTAGLLRPEPITTYPSETPTLLRSAFELAEQHGLTLTQLANELAWPVKTVRSRLGQIDNRPTLTLVREQ